MRTCDAHGHGGVFHRLTADADAEAKVPKRVWACGCIFFFSKMGGERGDPPIQQLRPKSKESAHSHRPPSFASSARNGLRPSLSGRPQQTAHFRVEDSSGLVQAEGNVAVACTVFDQASSRHDMKADPRSSKSGSERPGICSVEVTTSTVPWTPAVARQRSVDRSMR
jgi:hypothetical protein